jgi:hypothetical protein
MLSEPSPEAVGEVVAATGCGRRTAKIYLKVSPAFKTRILPASRSLCHTCLSCLTGERQRCCISYRVIPKSLARSRADPEAPLTFHYFNRFQLFSRISQQPLRPSGGFAIYGSFFSPYALYFSSKPTDGREKRGWTRPTFMYPLER